LLFEKIHVDTDGAGNSRVDYIYLNGTPIGSYQPSNNKFYFISTDRLGTPSTVTDSSQFVQWSATYQPFGNTTTGASGIVQNLRLPGQEWDLESTLNHNGFRDYATTLTRYIQSDPIGLAGGMNTYQYAKGNAFKWTDPKGLDTYLVNRDLSLFGSSSESRQDVITHTFVVVTSPDGTVAATYSWGNDANLRGWSLNQPLDISTARQALANGQAEWVGGSDLDPYIGQAYNLFVNSAFNHTNWVVTSNCKTEALRLIDRARTLQTLTLRGPTP
jgi:RHS repeat-associated protein